MDLKVVRYGVDSDGVALVTLDRPHRMNAWTGRMEQEYRWVMAQADQDAAVRVVVVTGAGSAFCAGADTAALEKEAASGRYDSGIDEPLAQPGAGVRPDFEQQHTFPLAMTVPTVAAVNGAAAGVGLVVACFCDVRFAASDAKLTTAHGRLGLPAEYGLAWMLPRLVGVGHAADLLLSSRVVTGDEAAAMGLVNASLPAAEVLPAALDWARNLARTVSPAAALVSKRQLYEGLLEPLGPQAANAVDLLHRMMGEPDFAEGVRAWMERRDPEWRPRPAR